MKKFKNGVIVSYIFLFVESISSILLTPMLVLYLGDSEYGVYGLAATISSYVLLLDLGVGNALVRYFSKYRVNNDNLSQKKLLGVSIVFYFLISLIAILILIITILFLPNIFAKGLTPSELSRAQLMIIVVGATSIITLMEAPFKRIIIAYEKFVLSKMISIIKVFFRIILIYVVLKCGGLGVAVLMVNLLLTILGTLFEVIYVFQKLKIKPLFKNIEKKFFKEIIVYSSFVFIQMIATQLNSMVDQVVISIFIPSATLYLSIYYIGINITHYFQNIGGAVNSLLMPKSVDTIEKKSSQEERLELMIKVTRIQLIVLGIILIVFLINGKEFVKIWVGDNKDYAYYVAIIIMLPQLFVWSQGIGSQLLWALNKHKEQAILQLIIAFVNILLTIILINCMHPLIGAAIGTAISSFFGNVVVSNIYYKKYIGIPISKYYIEQFKGILPSLIIAFVGGVIFKSCVKIENIIFSFLVNCSICVIIYIICIWLIGLNKSEKKLILKKNK